MRVILIFLLSFALIFALVFIINSKKECGDLLRKLAKKPEQLEFIECSAAIGQMAFTADYRVPGEKAALVEEFLNKEYGMAKLEFNCCLWESENGREVKLRLEKE